MDDAKKQLADQLSTSANILVTISRDPSIDQVASCIALTLLLNKMGKHAAAVFSGTVPSTLEFLQPEETIEKNTDSLRDFIIAIDKSKADKLRYKVEDDVVRIFITPYKTSISEDDLEFSEGDFNVDVVVAVGVTKQEDLDSAITSHGRILHDATITSINTSVDANMGTINWQDPNASSLSELVTELVQVIDPNLIDDEIATALLTGIVSETDRFSNEKTSSQTMSISAILMAAGADQQLVASKLEEDGAIPLVVKGSDDTKDSKKPDGELDIDHDDTLLEVQKADQKADQAAAETKPEDPKQPIAADGTPNAMLPPSQPYTPPPSIPPNLEPTPPKDVNPPLSTLSPGSKLVTEAPSLGGTLTANSQVEGMDPTTDPLSVNNNQPLLGQNPPSHTAPPQTSQPSQFAPPPSDWTPPAPNIPLDDKADQTLTDLESAVGSPHIETVDEAREEVTEALNDPTVPHEELPNPIEALNAQSLGGDLHPDQQNQPPEAPKPQDQQPGPGAPPPVPPPIPFQFGNPTGGSQEPPKQ